MVFIVFGLYVLSLVQKAYLQGWVVWPKIYTTIYVEAKPMPVAMILYLLFIQFQYKCFCKGKALVWQLHGSYYCTLTDIFQIV